ncbi:hypothetical protein [Acidocella sp. MX-AZ02]|uniref:hypothetical protein n=1 Tax=Acidocella sp. MX-AZ02 TaxID=1214225 RepID=UPI001969F0BB
MQKPEGRERFPPAGQIRAADRPYHVTWGWLVGSFKEAGISAHLGFAPRLIAQRLGAVGEDLGDADHPADHGDHGPERIFAAPALFGRK